MIANVSTSITSIGVSTNYTSIVGITGNITPPQIATAYNMPVNSGANVKVGIVSLGGGFLQSDLNKSLANLGLGSTTVTQVLLNGASGTFSTSDNNASIENTLDLYCVAGLVPSANIVLYITNSANITTSSWSAAFQRAVDENCDVITHSWSIAESYGNGDFLNSSLANATAKGITVFCSTGDYGSENYSGGTEGVNYPASSSNVVAVGGTILSVTAGNARQTEIADPISGGGLSSNISLPTWQSGLTYREYFTSNSSYGPTKSLTVRGIPDIAGPSENYAMWYNGSVQTGISGTSASTPIMAGMFARYISITGRRPIPNSIHPILYSNTNAYYDITTGNNDSFLTKGYSANIGWDPVVGLGVPYGNVVYQMVSSGGTTVKTAANTWSYLANVKVKTATNTWSNVRAIWTKTINGWSQTY
jgi:subtilase family serine protease